MPKCFIIMPISTPTPLLAQYRQDADHFCHVLDHLFVPAIEKAGFEPIRPKAEGGEVIHAHVIKNIDQSELVLCDMSALNPNVFFELGIRTAVDKPACMVVDDITSHVPFDTSIVNYHTYKSCLDPWVLAGEIDSLSSHIRATKEASVRNPLWRYFGLSATAHFSEKETGIDAKVDLITMRLDGLTKQLQERAQPSSTQKEEGQADPGFRLFRQLSDIAMQAGIERPPSGSVDGKQVTINVAGELPRHAVAEMTRLAKEAGWRLTINERPAGRK